MIHDLIRGDVFAAEERAIVFAVNTEGDARRAVWDGQTIATRQTRGDGSPFVVAARNLGKKAA